MKPDNERSTKEVIQKDFVFIYCAGSIKLLRDINAFLLFIKVSLCLRVITAC